MSSIGGDVCEETQNDILPISSAEPILPDAVLPADELSRTADAIDWTRAPECRAHVDSWILLPVGFNGNFAARKIPII